MYVVCSVYYKGKKEKVAKATTLQEQDPCGLRKSLCIYPIYFPYRHGNSLKLLYALYDGSGFSFYILHIKSHFIKCNMIHSVFLTKAYLVSRYINYALPTGN